MTGTRRAVFLRCSIAALLFLQSLAVAGTDEHAARRAFIMGLLDSTSAMVLRSPEMPMRSADANFRYRQESNLLFLTGENRPGLTLLLSPRGVQVDGVLARVILFVQQGSDDGSLPLSGLPDGVTLDGKRFPDVLSSLLPELRTLHATPFSPGFVQDWLNNRPMFLERDSRKELEKKYPQLKVKNAGLVVAQGRVIKSPWEVERIRASIAATGEGLRRAMEICKPGIREYELQAAIEYEMMKRGASAPSFQSIIGSGPNALILHYELNHRTAAAGELVVMDVGAEIGGYASDITRTIPVSGTFTREQRNVYGAVLRTRDSIVAGIRVGMPWSGLDRIARSVIEAEGFGRFWRHSVSHHLGIDVHDAGVMDTLRAGMVITVEPGVYIPATDTAVSSGFRGIGIRIEDDVLVTGHGAQVLSEGIPRTVDAIEKVMKKPQSSARGNR